MLPGSLEWWHVLVSLSAVILSVGMTIFGKGFAAWSARIKELGDRIDRRLTDIEGRMRVHESNMTALHITVERRVSWLEAKMNGHTREP